MGQHLKLLSLDNTRQGDRLVTEKSYKSALAALGQFALTAPKHLLD